jgi:crotonobetainyl-CoA:carnitine CoA-transferase CaiB-like acyl-CoA transferase
MDLPLAGIRIIDLSRVLAGPWATQMLADLGAEIIKIERPGTGDDTRSWGPPYAQTESKPEERGEAAYFLGANRGKKSVAIDLKSAEGVDLVRELAAGADVFIENFKVGDLQRYGLDEKTLKQANPGLIYCSITGFGQSGPRAKTAGYDLMIQGMAGLMSITGLPDDAPGGGPMKVGVAIVDILTGLHAAIGILAALQERNKTGQGRYIDLALYDVCAASLANQAMNWLVGGVAPQRMGNLHPNIAPYQTFASADGHMILAVGNDLQFGKLCSALAIAELPDDPRFASNSARVANRDALAAILTPLLATQNRDHWLEMLDPLGVPCGPINGLGEVFDDPQATARELVRNLPHGALGSVPSVANPLRFDGESMTSPNGAPVLGEHTHQVLRDVLGFSDEQIAALSASGAIADGSVAKG